MKKLLLITLFLTFILGCKKEKDVTPEYSGTIGTEHLYEGDYYKWDYSPNTGECKCWMKTPGYRYNPAPDEWCEEAGAGTKPE